jgi:hypothetical protein
MRKKNIPITLSRRKLLKGLAALPLVYGMSSVTSAANEITKKGGLLSDEVKPSLQELKGVLPKGKLGKHDISRLVMGCNPMGGFCHSRDLRYVGQLSKHWHTEAKMKETWAMGERAGINITNLIATQFKVFNEYKKETGSKMLNVHQASCGFMPGMTGMPGTGLSGPVSNDPYAEIKQGIDDGADIVYILGEYIDSLVQNEGFDTIQGALELIRKAGLPAGIGAHSIQSILATIKAGLKPDFYYKTFHHDKYWSATPREKRVEYPKRTTAGVPDHNQWNDNMWDQFPEQTIEVFKSINVPFFGFKVLAAGAIQPADGIRWAFENGADFVCMGMFDFQVVDDVNMAIEILGNLGKRERPWYA